MSRSERDFDLIVVGGGSGGLAGALRAAGHGARVALLEPGLLGGTCVNRGCVPKKAMWLAAAFPEQFERARALGFALPEQVTLDWATLLRQRGDYIARIHANYRTRLQSAGVEVIGEFGRLTSTPGEVLAGESTLRAARILLATGGHPLKPEIPGAEWAGVSDDFFELTSAPAHVAVVGGGYIGVELASALQAFGSRVQLFVREDRLLTRFDAEVTAWLAESMREAGIEVHFNSEVGELAGGTGAITVSTRDGKRHGPFAQVLFATGRAPNTRGLGLEEAGIACDGRGQVIVDAWQATSRAEVFAVGDVTPQPKLTPVAIAAARRLMDRLYGGEDGSRLALAQVPTVVFTHPPLATVGLSEAEAREVHGEAVSVHRADFRPMLQALGDGPQRCVFKLVCVGEDERVVGLHLVGPGSDEILQGFAVAMQCGLTRRDLRDTLAIHPTSAEEVVLI